MKANISVKIPELSSHELLFLKELGLSDHEIQVYQVLAADKKKTHTAQQVAAVLMVYPNALYRIFRQLQSFGLVRFIQGRPMAFQATEKSQAYVAAYTQKRSMLDTLLSAMDVNTANQNSVRIIAGRQSLYKRYIELAMEAKTEICVFAIGIAYSDMLHDVQQNAINRGVYIRHIVQQVQPSNYSIIHKWQRLGVKVRHAVGERGYHVTVIDRKVALVTFSSVADTEDRLTIEVVHPTAVLLFQSQFEALWTSAQSLKKHG